MYRTVVAALVLAPSLALMAQESAAFHRPVFLPDGETLVVMSNRHGGDWELYSIGIDGSHPRRLTDHVGWDGYADVSPDGRHIVFDRSDDERSGMVMLAIDGGGERWLLESNGDFLGGARFAPDGRSIVFLSEESGNREIYRLWLADERRERITETDHDESDAVFAPDGRRLAYTVWLDDERSALETLDLTTGAVHRVAVVEGRLYGVAWGAAGETLYYNADSDGDQDIYGVSLETGQPEKLTDNEVPDHLPMVSPDGHYVVFTSERNGGEEVFMIDLASGAQRQLQLRSW
jgi:Tol biopolymer transport system component